MERIIIKDEPFELSYMNYNPSLYDIFLTEKVEAIQNLFQDSIPNQVKVEIFHHVQNILEIDVDLK